MPPALALGGGALLGAGLGIAGNVLGAHAQESALDDALKPQQALLKRLMDFQQQIYGEAAPYREASLGMLGPLQQQALNPTLSEGYKLASQEGLDLLKSNAAVTGDPFSGPSQLSQGRFLSGLLASERDRQIQTMFGLAGLTGNMANQASGLSANLLTGQAGPVNQISGNIQNQGAVMGGLYGSIGQTLAGLPFGMMGGMGGMGGAPQMPAFPQGTMF